MFLIKIIFVFAPYTIVSASSEHDDDTGIRSRMPVSSLARLVQLLLLLLLPPPLEQVLLLFSASIG